MSKPTHTPIFYKGRGEHSVNQLEDMVEAYKEKAVNRDHLFEELLKQLEMAIKILHGTELGKAYEFYIDDMKTAAKKARGEG